jgi:hypothetical protein
MAAMSRTLMHRATNQMSWTLPVLVGSDQCEKIRAGSRT